METTKKNDLKKDLRELKLVILCTKVLLILYKKSSIQIFGLLIALLWTYVSYWWKGTLAPGVFIVSGMFLFVKYAWLPALTESNDVNEIKIELNKLQQEEKEKTMQLNEL